jgi:transcriptional regulator with PAS, ATPase and Fis domain
VPITIPPLRERRDDIIPLIYHFLEEYNRKYDKAKKISAEAKDILIKYDWPGNVRELENTVERLVVTVEEDVILPHHLPENLKEANVPSKAVNVDSIMPLKDAVEMVERQLLQKVVEQCNSTYDIAEILGVNQSTVVRKIQKYGIKTKKNHKDG